MMAVGLVGILAGRADGRQVLGRGGPESFDQRRRERHRREPDGEAGGRARLGAGGSEVDPARPAAGVEVRRVEVDPLGEQGRDQVVELGQARPARQVGGDREGRSAPQGVLDEAGEIAPGPDVDEDVEAVGVNRLDRLAERHRAGPLVDREPADRLGVVGHPAGDGAGVQGDLRGLEVETGEIGLDRGDRRGETGRVVGPGEGEVLADDAPSPEPIDHGLDRAGLARQDDLVRAVVHRDLDQAADLGDGRLDPGPVRPDRGEAGRREGARGFEAGEDRGELAEPVLECAVGFEDPAGREGEELAAAVAEHGAGLDAEVPEQLVQAALGGEDDVDADLGRPERGGGPVGLAEQELARPGRRARRPGDPVRRIEEGPDLGEVRAEVGEHPGILRPLAREQEGEPGRLARLALAKISPPGVPDRPAGRIFQLRQGRDQPARQVLGSPGDQAEPPGAGDRPGVERERQVLPVRRRPAFEPGQDRSNPRDQARAIGGGEQDGLGLPPEQRPGRPRIGRSRMFFEHRVGVDPGEAEGIHARPPGRVGVAVDPGGGPCG